MTLTPPPAPQASGAPHPADAPVASGAPLAWAPPPQKPSSGSRVVAILAIVLGGLLLVGVIGGAVITTLAAASVHTSSRTASVAGVSGLDVDVSAGSLRVEFGDVREAELEVRSPSGAERWVLERDGDQLVVSSPQRFGGWLFENWFFGRPGDGVLRLPASLQLSAADVDLSAGEVIVDGDFGELDVTVSAGKAIVHGSAESLITDVSAGEARLELDDVATARLGVSAGSLDARFSGAAPREVGVEISAGSAQLRVPEGVYAVESSVSAGDFDNRIGSTPGASNTISVHVSAGSAVLRTH